MTHPLARKKELDVEARRRKVAAILLSGVSNQSATYTLMDDENPHGRQ